MTTMSAKSTMIDDVISSIFVPGTNSGLVKAMTASFFSLFLTLLGMLWLTGGNLHVWALLGLSLGTFGSIRWFLIQIAPIEEQKRQERAAEEKLKLASGEPLDESTEKPKTQ